MKHSRRVFTFLLSAFLWCSLNTARAQLLSSHGIGQPDTNTFPDMSIDQLTALANNGNTAAMIATADRYNLQADSYEFQNDEEENKNRALAATWYRKAAEAGDMGAQAQLAFLYFMGKGVPQSEVEALKWYRKAADQGDAASQLEVARYLQAGRGGATADQAEAAKWYRKAADQGNADAEEELSQRYAQGIGVKKDQAEADKWQAKVDAQKNGGNPVLRAMAADKPDSNTGDQSSSAATAPAPAGKYPKQLIDLVTDVQQKVKQKDFSGALDAIKKALPDSSDKPTLLMLRAGVRLEKGDTDGANRDIHDALDHNSPEPSDYQMNTYRVSALTIVNDLEGAAAELKKGMPDLPAAFYKGMIHIAYASVAGELGDWVTAQADYAQAKGFENMLPNDDPNDLKTGLPRAALDKTINEALISWRDQGAPLKPEVAADAENAAKVEASLNAAAAAANDALDKAVQDMSTPAEESPAVKPLSEDPNLRDGETKSQLAVRYENGDGVPKDYDKAFQNIIADSGGEAEVTALVKKEIADPDAHITARLAKAANLDGKTFEKTKEAADGGDSEAAYKTGLSYYLGKGVAKDNARAFQYFEKATSTPAAFHVVFLAAQQGVPEAKALIDKAHAQAEAVNCQNNLKQLYLAAESYSFSHHDYFPTTVLELQEKAPPSSAYDTDPSAYLPYPKILICPSAKKNTDGLTWDNFDMSDMTYKYHAPTIKNSSAAAATTVLFSCPIHKISVMADGNIQQN